MHLFYSSVEAQHTAFPSHSPVLTYSNPACELQYVGFIMEVQKTYLEFLHVNIFAVARLAGLIAQPFSAIFFVNPFSEEKSYLDYQ